MKAIPPRNVAEELAALDARIKDLLPDRYLHCYTDVSPTSMGSATLKYGPDGKVAWDQIWTTFCDLALAGGPPHRGKLMEPVKKAEAEADPARTAEVAAEISRAVGLTAGISTVPDAEPNWIGVPCSSAEEAAWLQFAVTAENVSARRLGKVLRLPVGPAFRPEKEIKNVTVALTKSSHYWDGHLSSAQQKLGGTFAWEPATPDEVDSNPAAYEASLSAMRTALEAVGKPLVVGRYTGWIGVETSGEDEAVWLLRAILVDRVLARREENVLYLPVVAPANEEHQARVAWSYRRACELWTASAPKRTAWRWSEFKG
ncbi:MAG: hypothetical protein U0800_04065 [Isosphaeraceae bacterium]